MLIRVVATSVNPVDWKVRDDDLSAMLQHDMPLTLGWDVSGVLHQMGAKATKFAIGDAVYALPAIARDGTYAEYVAVHEDHIAMKPRRGVMASNGLLVVSSPPSPPSNDQHGLRVEFSFTQPNAAALGQLATLVDTGALRPIIDSEFALADMRAAHVCSRTGRSQGKIAIYVGQP